MRYLLITKKVHLNNYLWPMVSLACALVVLMVVPAYAQEEMTALHKVQSLRDPSFTNKITVYTALDMKREPKSFNP